MSNESPVDAPQGPAGHTGAALLVSVAEASMKLGVSKMTINRRILAGVWPSGRCGRKHLLPLAFIDGLVREINAGRRPNFDEYGLAWIARSATDVAA